MTNNPVKKTIRKIIQTGEMLGLFIITLATFWSIGEEVIKIIKVMSVTLGDLLMMFIYLEILAMVAVYMDSGKLPIRMPMYIAIVALSRYLILDMKNLTEWQMLAIAVTLFLLTVSILVLRYGHNRIPYITKQENNIIDLNKDSNKNLNK